MPKRPFSVAGQAVRILLIMADDGDAAVIQSLIPETAGLKCEWWRVSCLDEARELLGRQSLDVVMLDLAIPGKEGVQSLLVLQAMAPDKPVVVIAPRDDEGLGVEAVQQGAQEYLVKGEMDSRMVARIVRYAIERGQVEEQLRSSLAEKETLLREVHHRVKNNLQLILSLLRLGSEHVPEGEARRIFQDSHNRIRSMSMIHENLYRSRDVSKVPFHDYVHELMKELFSAHNAWARGIEMDLQVAAIELGIDMAIPCGLILHELVTNALEHAFPDGGNVARHGGCVEVPSKGKRLIQVIFRRMEDGNLHLQVCDNGVGMPPKGVAREKKSIGLELVTTLAGQLGGVLQCHSGLTTCYGVVFPEKRIG